MIDKNTIDAYHKITAPKGLQERIEARVLAQQSAAKNRWTWEMFRVPAVTLAAAAMVCLIVWAGGAGMTKQPGENNDHQIAEMRLGGQSEITLLQKSSEVLGSEKTVLDVNEAAAVFQIAATEPVTVKASGDILSIYDADQKLWSAPDSELILELEGELRVLLSPVGEEVFYIEMSTAEETKILAITYDEKTGQYLASLSE